MCSHAQSLFLLRIKESLAIYYLRSLCLYPSNGCSAFAGSYLPEGILRTVGWLPCCGGAPLPGRADFRAAAGRLCPDELYSVLYRLVINCEV